MYHLAFEVTDFLYHRAAGAMGVISRSPRRGERGHSSAVQRHCVSCVAVPALREAEGGTEGL